MDRHRFDPVALVFGLVFLAAGVIVLADGRLIDEGRVLAPLGLVGLGVALLLRPSSPSRPPTPLAAPGPPRRPAGADDVVTAPPTGFPTHEPPSTPDRPAGAGMPADDVPASEPTDQAARTDTGIATHPPRGDAQRDTDDPTGRATETTDRATRTHSSDPTPPPTGEDQRDTDDPPTGATDQDARTDNSDPARPPTGEDQRVTDAPAAEATDRDARGGSATPARGPGGPGVNFYLGPDWRPPTDASSRGAAPTDPPPD